MLWQLLQGHLAEDSWARAAAMSAQMGRMEIHLENLSGTH